MISASEKVLSSVESTTRFSILQFLPNKLGDISKRGFFNYNDKKLKTSYLVDITHNLILKYYFKKENYFPLYSLILREKYGQYYSHYINFLVENGVISLVKNYRKGGTSKIYSLESGILKSEIGRFKNSDKIVLKKYNFKLDQSRRDPSLSPIPIHIRSKLISDLGEFKIDYNSSRDFIKGIKEIDSINRNLYSIDSIESKNLFYHFDKFGRFHTNFTILKSEIRKRFLTINGELTKEIDIKNSQPFFLSKLIKIVNTNWVDGEELELFTLLVENGEFYNYLIDKLKLGSKDESKKLVYKVFFGQNRRGSLVDEKFKSLFPTIHNFIKLYKRENSDYRSLSHHLQKMESNLIFNKLLNRIMETNSEIKVLTIHDSIIVAKQYEEIVKKILDDEMSKI